MVPPSPIGGTSAHKRADRTIAKTDSSGLLVRHEPARQLGRIHHRRAVPADLAAGVGHHARGVPGCDAWRKRIIEELAIARLHLGAGIEERARRDRDARPWTLR